MSGIIGERGRLIARRHGERGNEILMSLRAILIVVVTSVLSAGVFVIILLCDARRESSAPEPDRMAPAPIRKELAMASERAADARAAMTSERLALQPAQPEVVLAPVATELQ